MSGPITVLVVDDSPLFAEAIRLVVESDPGFRVVGVAGDGRLAVEMVRALEPKVITMDVHMPVMDGLEAIAQIMADHPTPILVVTSDPRAAPGDELHFEALRRGALDVFPKPTSWPADAAQGEALRGVLRLLSRVPVVRHLAGHRHRWRPVELPRPSRRRRSRRPAAHSSTVVAIAASTGGPAALARTFEALPGDFPAPILVVQHIAAGFTRSFASWLDDSSPLDVRVATDGHRPQPGQVLIAPDEAHLLLADDGALALVDEAPVDGHRPSATRLFDSVASAAGANAVGVILTGMGSDGVTGLDAIRRAGGFTMAQDEASSVVWGMPRVAAETGAAVRVLPLSEIPSALIAAVERRPDGDEP